MQKKVMTNKKIGKSVTFIDIKNIKVIQNAILSNKIECYNKEVQRSPSCSAKCCTHSSKY